jgi:hypothetical protein
LYLVKDASIVSVQVAPIDLERGRLTGPPVLEIFRSQGPDWLPFLAIRSLEAGQVRVRDLRPSLS